jgi:hypothetical protein
MNEIINAGQLGENDVFYIPGHKIRMAYKVKAIKSGGIKVVPLANGQEEGAERMISKRTEVVILRKYA